MVPVFYTILHLFLCRYLEKQAFLQRTDERQFERERDMRQGKRKM